MSDPNNQSSAEEQGSAFARFFELIREHTIQPLQEEIAHLTERVNALEERLSNLENDQ